MSDETSATKPFDHAEHWRRVKEEQRQQEERLAYWVLPGPGDDPAQARLRDGRLVWQVVADLWAHGRGRDVARAAAAGVAEAAALDSVLEYFRRHGDGLIGVLSRSVPADALPAPPALPDFDTLPPSLRAALAACRVDLLAEKHEGPWNRYWPYGDDPDGWPQFQAIAGQVVLLPVERERHAALTVRRAVVAASGDTLLLELRDAKAEEWYGQWFNGQFAVCDRWPGHRFLVCHTYHEWYPVGPGAGAWGIDHRD
ncbi:MAG: hypothetical protein IT340_00490 [Chloroflexi bacterium]|nr:hypothetical protein [Chloroflexota bacterium]